MKKYWIVINIILDKMMHGLRLEVIAVRIPVIGIITCYVRHVSKIEEAEPGFDVKHRSRISSTKSGSL